MKKRILALLLLVAMLLGVLTSCGGYSYAEDDMSKYVNVEGGDLKALLNKLVIEDGDFTANEATRQEKVMASILTTIAKLSTTKITTGTPNAQDKVYNVYYNFFAVVDGEGVNNITDCEEFAGELLFAASVAGSASSLVLGTAEDGSFNAKIEEAFKQLVFQGYKAAVEDDEKTEDVDETAAEVLGNLLEVVTDKAYKITAKDVIYVTYTKTEKDNSSAKGVTYTNVRLWNVNNSLGNTVPEEFVFSEFIDKTLGTVDNFEHTDADGVTYKYSDIKVNTIVKAGTMQAGNNNPFNAPIVIKHTPYPDSSANAHKVTASNGAQVEIGGKELTYYIYPVYYTEYKTFDNFTYQDIIKEIYGKNIKSDNFSDEILEAKNGDITFKELVDGNSESTEAALKDSLATIIGYINTPSSHPDTKAEGDAKKTDAQIKEQYEGYLNTRFEKIAAMTVDGKDISTALRDDYKKTTYDSLEAKYIEEVKANLADAFHHIIMEKITIKEGVALPEKAVDEVYEILYENAKNTFNNGYDNNQASATYQTAYYAIYKGSFDNYLIATYTSNGTADQAREQIRKNAEAMVETSIKLHYAAEVYGVKISEDEFEDLYDAWYESYEINKQIYEMMGMAYETPGEIGIRMAYQLERLYGTLLYVKGEKEAIDAYQEALKDDPNAEYTFETNKYIDKTVDGETIRVLELVNIAYTFKK